jgi:hypothetical protein
MEVVMTRVRRRRERGPRSELTPQMEIELLVGPSGSTRDRDGNPVSVWRAFDSIDDAYLAWQIHSDAVWAEAGATPWAAQMFDGMPYVIQGGGLHAGGSHDR